MKEMRSEKRQEVSEIMSVIIQHSGIMVFTKKSWEAPGRFGVECDITQLWNLTQAQRPQGTIASVLIRIQLKPEGSDLHSGQ